MECDEVCYWFLINLGEDFAIQYTGPEPEQNFPTDIDGFVAHLRWLKRRRIPLDDHKPSLGLVSSECFSFRSNNLQYL
jgi:hypothetical protein